MYKYLARILTLMLEAAAILFLIYWLVPSDSTCLNKMQQDICIEQEFGIETIKKCYKVVEVKEEE